MSSRPLRGLCERTPAGRSGRSIVAADVASGPGHRDVNRHRSSLARDGLPPETVAEVVAGALTARRPRTRYVIGREAKALAVLARLLPDRAFDAFIARALRSLRG